MKLSFMSNPVRLESQPPRGPTKTEEVCGFCGGTIKKVKEPLIFKGVKLGLFSVEKCNTCCETVYPNSAWNAIKRFLSEPRTRR